MADVALIAELQVVRSGYVRCRCPHLRQRADLMILESLLERLVKAVDEVGNSAELRTERCVRALFHDRNHRVVVRAVDARRRIGVLAK